MKRSQRLSCTLSVVLECGPVFPGLQSVQTQWATCHWKLQGSTLLPPWRHLQHLHVSIADVQLTFGGTPVVWGVAVLAWWESEGDGWEAECMRALFSACSLTLKLKRTFSIFQRSSFCWIVSRTIFQSLTLSWITDCAVDLCSSSFRSAR